jgi:hypothetical protein
MTTVLLGSLMMSILLLSTSAPGRTTFASCCCSFCPGSVSPWSRFRAFTRLNAVEVMDTVGSDAARYLKFQKLIVKLYVFLTAVAVFTMAVNYSGDHYELAGRGISAHTQYYFLRTTLFNLEASSSLGWLHLLIFYLQSSALYYFIYRYHKDVVGLASVMATKSASAACTVQIYGLPSYTIHDSDLQGAPRLLHRIARFLADAGGLCLQMWSS